MINSDNINGLKERNWECGGKIHLNERTYLQMSGTSARIGERLPLVHPLEYWKVWAIQQNIFKQMSAKIEDLIADDAILPKWDWNEYSMKTSTAVQLICWKVFLSFCIKFVCFHLLVRSTWMLITLGFNIHNNKIEFEWNLITLLN